MQVGFVLNKKNVSIVCKFKPTTAGLGTFEVFLLCEQSSTVKPEFSCGGGIFPLVGFTQS